ncbi:hypothetical protein SDC9_08711 [bioreactor metagenome]|uniref:Protein containing methyltransferase domain n=2 Tax=root TaxID=1 RepID=A0A0S7BV54_9BACT|nr:MULTISPECIES: class I SAM-dependent methyltransferase [Lentimicrobium]MEA5109310.1 class I SAM-dependent methyltransferase [Lentimicrobium sp.]GAP42443.1 protein containing methyltransferase domain [Lentimicrobium saccharophilum]
MKEHWDERYSATDYIYGTNPNLWFRDKLLQLTPGSLLLPAEGEGRNAVFAAKNGWKVLALDQSTEGRKKALKLADREGVRIDYLISNLHEFNDIGMTFDAIALIFVHLPPEVREQVHRHLTGFLKPGGFLILEAFTDEQLKNTSGGPKTPLLLYNSKIIERDFNQLRFIDFTESTVILDEGPLHRGEAHVVRLFAQKPFPVCQQ